MDVKRGLIVLMAVAAASCTGGGDAARPSSSPIPGQKPVRVGGVVACPLNAAVVAIGEVYYPPGYPSEAVPEPERCFSSVTDAIAAGLHAAPPPPGAKVVGGIYLVPAEPSLLAECRRAARRLGFAVACPTLVPAPATAIEPVDAGDAEFLLEEQFAAPASYIGSGTAGIGASKHSLGHLWVGSVPRIPRRGFCSDATNMTQRVVRGGAGTSLECPEGSETHSGHVLLVWDERGATHFVSLHGHTPTNLRLDRLIARAVHVVR